MSDVALADYAECVMLNKGPYIVEAVRLLDDVLLRMQGHQHKKSPQLRAYAPGRSCWRRDPSVVAGMEDRDSRDMGWLTILNWRPATPVGVTIVGVALPHYFS